MPDLATNGNNYVSKDVIDPEVFKGNLGVVVIEEDGSSTTHERMKLIACQDYGTETWFIIEPMSEAEINDLNLKMAIAELAEMVAGV